MRALCTLRYPLAVLATFVVLGCSSSSPDDPVDPSQQGNDTGKKGKAEAWDDQNAPSVFGLSSVKLEELQKENALKGYLKEKPWGDTYWPLNKKGLSNRWNGHDSFETFDAQKTSAIEALKGETFESTWQLSPAEKYDILVGDANYSLTKEGWDVFDQYKDYKYSWSWMGHCHGWAPAAYLEATPKASVMAKIGDEQVLFTEGDIRGLLTKAHATNSTSNGTRFLGTRCNARTILRDDKGRVVDGTVYAPKADAPKEADTSKAATIYIQRNFWERNWVLTFSESADSSAEKVMQATAEASQPEGAVVVNIYASVDDYQNEKVEKEAIFIYTKECRDTNPGSFHLALVQYLSDANEMDAKRGFVMDVTREDQVWNQPVYGFESKITSVEKVADIQDPLAAFRAKGTVQIAHVESEVFYGLENGPYVHFSESQSSSITSKTYRYSLEIDKDGFVIGGEWDSSSTAPDFLWAPQGKLQDSDTFKYSKITKIHKCSLEVDRARTLKLPDSQEIQVVDCEL